jgi:hypothetical protein
MSAISIRAEYLALDRGKSSVTADYAGLFPSLRPTLQQGMRP